MYGLILNGPVSGIKQKKILGQIFKSVVLEKLITITDLKEVYILL